MPKALADSTWKSVVNARTWQAMAAHQSISQYEADHNLFVVKNSRDKIADYMSQDKVDNNCDYDKNCCRYQH